MWSPFLTSKKKSPSRSGGKGCKVLLWWLIFLQCITEHAIQTGKHRSCRPERSNLQKDLKSHHLEYLSRLRLLGEGGLVQPIIGRRHVHLRVVLSSKAAGGDPWSRQPHSLDSFSWEKYESFQFPFYREDAYMKSARAMASGLWVFTQKALPLQ